MNEYNTETSPYAPMFQGTQTSPPEHSAARNVLRKRIKAIQRGPMHSEHVLEIRALQRTLLVLL